jgi:hypothetical protein
MVNGRMDPGFSSICILADEQMGISVLSLIIRKLLPESFPCRQSSCRWHQDRRPGHRAGPEVTSVGHNQNHVDNLWL